MKNIITYFNEKCIQKIAENITDLTEKFYQDPTSLADYVLGIHRATDELGRHLVETCLEDMDRAFRDSPERRQSWEIKKTDSRKLLTSLGEIHFHHTLFLPKDLPEKAGRYLLDEQIGLEPAARMTEDAEAAIYQAAAEHPYHQAGSSIHPSVEVSRQTVKNKIHALRFPPRKKPEKKREAEYLYIEADEDHVSLQFKEQKGDLTKDGNGRKNNGVLCKLVYVHEGIRRKAPGERRTLIHPYYFSGVYDGEENRTLWREVFTYLHDTYDLEKVKAIYLGADGGGWIRGAGNEIPGLTEVLDEFHLSKYLLKITAFLQDSGEDARRELREAIRGNQKEKFTEVIRRIEGLNETETGKKRIAESEGYIRENWEPARLRLCRGEGILGCSAEGHVSHLLSARMSSRPMGWSRRGADRMSRLRAYVKNGGDLLELARYQRYPSEGKEDGLKEASGWEGLSCTAILRSERNPHPQLGKYVEALQVSVSREIRRQSWYKGIQRRTEI